MTIRSKSFRQRPLLQASAAFGALVLSSQAFAADGQIIHDAEHYVLEAQHGEKWAMEDADIQAKLDALEAKHGTKPNIIHIMWDDTAVGEIGIPEIQAGGVLRLRT